MPSQQFDENGLVSQEWLTQKRLELERKRLSTSTASRSKEKPHPLLKLCPHTPTTKQAEFLSLECLEAFYGGQGGGGKSDALLMGALQYVHIPNYSALILRRTFKDLNLPGAIMDRAKKWLRGQPGVHWDSQEHRFTFQCPGGGTSTLAFGYLDHLGDERRYASAEFQYIAFDEASEFVRSMYTFLFSRLRRLLGMLVPLRMRSASNPGGIGHAWLRERFIDPATRRPKAVFVPASRYDNPHLDLVSYEEALDELDPEQKAWIRDGRWDDIKPGDFFDQNNFVLITEEPMNLGFMRRVRYWDFAGKAEPAKAKKRGPDYTASCLMALSQGARRGEEIFYILDVTEDRWDAGVLPDHVQLQAEEDGRAVAVRWEMEGGSSGLIASERAIKPSLRGFDADGIRSTGDKSARARPIAAKVSKRRVHVLVNEKTKKFLDQCHRFPAVEHDDMVDAMSGAYNWLLENSSVNVKGQAVVSGATRTFDVSNDHVRPLDQRGRKVRKVRGPYG
jgi:predicted phage terminase large subunit-like protein